jgi:hypothetical protein
MCIKVSSKTLGIEGKKLLTPQDDYDALKEFNQAYEGTKSAIEEMHLEYQNLLQNDAGLEARLKQFPGAVFSGRKRPDKGVLGVFFCYALPALDKETGEFTEKAGTTRWYLYDLKRDIILEEPGEIVTSIRSQADTPRHCSTDEKTLKIPEGVTPDEPFVQILDPATGTGTFLVEVIEVIHKTMTAKWRKQGCLEMELSPLWNEYVPRYRLPRLHGYELLMAPYAIAHLKIGLKLYETGYRFDSDERARIYLTNALEPANDQQLTMDFLPAFAHEAEEVNAVKRKRRFTVVIGNPPYAGHSANTGEWISNLVQNYYQVDGAGLGERNPKWLQDDYVKFIRLAQYTLSTTAAGILGFITNHSFLDNPTFRGMKFSLIETFSELWLHDLHGNSKKRERSPDGTADENVFDIQQGVAITVGLLSSLGKGCVVRHADLFGPRDHKYAALSQNTSGQTTGTTISCVRPFFLLIPLDVSIREEYEKGLRLPEVMAVNVLGFQSHRDNFAIDFDRAALLGRIIERIYIRQSGETRSL